MIGFALVLLAARSAQQPAAGSVLPVALKRTFVKGQKSAYTVDANLEVEERHPPLDTFLPDVEEIKYTFYTKVLDVEAGIASIRYSKPSVATTGGETPDADPKTTVEHTNDLVLVSLSPINEILDYKDKTPKKKAAQELVAKVRSGNPAPQLGAFIGPFLSDLYRLCLFIGDLDTSLDFAPKFDLGPVKPGDSWKRTVGYQPQKLANKSGHTVVQRLDMTYVYAGMAKGDDGKAVRRVTAEVKLDTDLGTYLNELIDMKPEQSGVKSIPLKLEMHLTFDLDPNTLQTLKAHVASTGSSQIFETASPDPVEEINIKGTTDMVLDWNKQEAPEPAKK